MKAVCIIYSMAVGTWSVEEKPFDTMAECLAWKRQMEFHYAVPPALAVHYVCEERVDGP